MRLRLSAILLAAAPAIVAAQGTSDHGAFIMRVGVDTIVIERFARSADTLRGSVSVKSQPRLDYTAMIGPDQSVKSLDLQVYAAGAPADASPLQRVRVVMTADSARTETNGAPHAFPISRGAVPFMNNSFALGELFTRKARAARSALDIPIWALSGAANLVLSVKPLGPDSMSLIVNGQEQRVRVDALGRILGGTIPSQHLEIIRVDGAAASSLRLGKVDYSPPAGAPYQAVDVRMAGQGGIPLGGTLTIPNAPTGRVPAVVMITGSGQQDRDEAIAIVPGGFRPFRQIADTLGRRGIAVLRLDDRMVGASGGKIGTSADYAEDIRAAIAFLRARPDIDGDRIGLVGHSEGGMIAPMIAATDPRLKGIVLLAGPAEKGIDIIHFQQRDAIFTDSSIKASDRDSLLRVSAATLDTIAAKDVWIKYFLTYDPLATAQRVRVPTLILQGGTDRQILPEQAKMLGDAMTKAGNADVTVHVFPGLNHLFIPDPSGRPAGYTTLKSNRMSSEVLGTLADWLVARLGAGRL